MEEDSSALVVLQPELRVQYRGWRASSMAATPKHDRNNDYSRWCDILVADLQELCIESTQFIPYDIEFFWSSGVAKCKWHGPKWAQPVSEKYTPIRRSQDAMLLIVCSSHVIN